MEQSSNKAIWWIIIIVILAIVIYTFVASTSSSPSTNPTNSTSTTDMMGTSSDNTATGDNTPAGSAGTGSTLSDSDIAQMINSASVTAPSTGTTLALTNGTASYKTGSATSTITIGAIVGKVFTESGYDVFVDTTVTTVGNPAVEHYLSLFHVAGTTVTDTSSVLIGDRLVLKTVVPTPDVTWLIDANQNQYLSSTKGYTLTVNYLDRENGQAATATPTVAKSITVSVMNHLITK
jgi:hypothetical protein